MDIDRKPLVTIVTPLFNAERYIGDTIRSVINQSYTNWEMIIVDDCSTDLSLEIAKSFAQKDPRISVIESERNFGGPARPRNIGLDNTRGKYVAFLDADDVWLSGKLEKQVHFMSLNSDIDICHTLANVIDGNGHEKGAFDNQRLYRKLKFFVADRNIIYYSNFININSVLMRFDDSMRFAEDENLVALEDWAYWIDNNNCGKRIRLINEALLNYRIHNGSISNRGSDKGYRKAIYMISKYLVNAKIKKKHAAFSILLHFFKMKTQIQPFGSLLK